MPKHTTKQSAKTPALKQTLQVLNALRELASQLRFVDVDEYLDEEADVFNKTYKLLLHRQVHLCKDDSCELLHYNTLQAPPTQAVS